MYHARMLTGYRRSGDRAVRRLDAAVTTDILGTGIRHYAVIDGAVRIGSSVRALARELGRVTLEPLALAEALAFGLVLRDRTVFSEIRSVPAHTTLHPDGRLETHAGPRSTGRITDPDEAARRLRGVLGEIVAAEEPRHAVHLAGLTGGRDSRILAALPKRDPDRWHWLSVAGEGDAEHQGATATAARLGLRHHAWLPWTADYVAGGVHRVSADLVDGIGAVSDASLLRGYFEAYAAGTAHADAALWIGTLADGLFAATWMAPATTIWDALAPRHERLARILAPALVERFAADEPFYRSNPFDVTPASSDETGVWLRHFTRGRAYLCRLLTCFDRVCPTQLNPYLHPEVIDLALAIAPGLRASDAVRTGVLRGLGPELDAPSAFGYKAPGYAAHVLGAVVDEVRGCERLDGVLEPGLLDDLRRGELRDLAAPGDVAASGYRVHDDPSPLLRSLRDYEHLLTYATFLNLVRDDGVEVRR